jgi:DDE superfamily endonuclease
MAPAVREAIEKAKANLRYLPKYSPDLNPIELRYSKFKTFLRKVAARTVPDLTRAIRSFIAQLRSSECANYFAHAGYASKRRPAPGTIVQSSAFTRRIASSFAKPCRVSGSR